ncbi:MAG: type 4a pilus biogenesis protein PilO [Oligoflexia bacterium]|nr:type 4a pilus biogenesis protein PilO [Oligoflexia bacterium]
MATLQDRLKLAPKSFFLLVGLGLAASLYYSYGSKAEELAPLIVQLRADVEKNRIKLKVTQDRAQDKGKFQEEMERISQTFRLALDYLPKELEIQDMLKKIYSEARTAGVELSNFKPKEVVVKDFYEELPMEIQLKGTYPQMVNFLGNVSKIPRIINIRNVEIDKPVIVDGYPVMRMTGVLVGYRYKEPR